MKLAKILDFNDVLDEKATAIDAKTRKLLSSAKDYVFYVKESRGKDGEIIDVYKFRTMKKDADDYFENVFENGRDKYGNIINDNRSTNFGKFLRKYWIDEIPQVYNWMKGDIKFVGVRPMRDVDWEGYPEDVEGEERNKKPGWLGPQYADSEEGDFQTHVDKLRKYQLEYKKNPTKTDIKYFFRILKNIILGRVRSS